jgi:hypothetical protein
VEVKGDVEVIDEANANRFMAVFIVLGALLVGVFGWLIGIFLKNRKMEETQDLNSPHLSHEPSQHKLQLREEKLEIPRVKSRRERLLFIKKLLKNKRILLSP